MSLQQLTAEQIARTASTWAANTKRSGSADNTKANKSSNQKSESTTTDKSKDNEKGLDKQKPKLKPKPKLPPDRQNKGMTNLVSTYNKFQTMEVVECADDEEGSDDGVAMHS